MRIAAYRPEDNNVAPRHAHDSRDDDAAAPPVAAPPQAEPQLEEQPPRLPPLQRAAPSSSATDCLSLLALSAPEIFDRISESLISRGALNSLASLNGSSRSLYYGTLALLWRTFIWDSKRRSKQDEDVDAYWKFLTTCRGAKYIR